MIFTSTSSRLILFVMMACFECQLYTASKSLIKQGDIMIQGLFPITSRQDEMCEGLYKEGVIWAMAMKFAIDSINNSSLLKNITLGYKIDNTCQHIPTAMHRAIETVAKYRPHSVCYPKKDYCDEGSQPLKKISAVIGPAMSWIAIPIASLLGLYEIPQISYAATSRILSDKTRYNSFVRTVPSDEYQAKAMAEFVEKFGWNYVFLIASDDDYGKMGAATFKNTAKSLNVCIANDEYIPFKSDIADEYLKSTLINLKTASRAKVVIVFSYANQGEILLKEAEKMNITDRTWITSDGWSSSVTDFNLTPALLEGIITFSIRSKRVATFVDYINELRIKDVENIPWYLNYMENILDCNHGNNTGKRRCHPDEKLPTNHSIANEAIANVIDAVNATANAIANLCTSSSECKDFLIEPSKLLHNIKNVSFPGADNTNVDFNDNGDRTSSGYSIRNVQIDSDGKLVYVDIGYWSQTQGSTFFDVNTSLIKWNQGYPPQSNCFRLCQPGERIVGRTECCWNCEKCEKGTFSSISGALSCTKCNETHYTNEEKTMCIARELVYLSLNIPAGVSILIISIVGIVFTTIIAGIFVKHRGTPVIASSSVFHHIMFFMILYISFFFALAFTLSKPYDASCIVIESIFELFIMLYPSFLLSKTQVVNKFTQLGLKRVKTLHPEWSHIVIVVSLMILQFILVALRQFINPSHIHFVNQVDKTRLLECEQVFPSLRVLAITVPSCILFIVTFISFRERDKPDNFNEAKFIGFTTILLCIIFISFISTYKYVTGISRILVVTFTAFVAAFSGMGCLCVPKLYIILMHPERNVSQGRSSIDSDTSGQQNPSLRTSVAETPDLNSNIQTNSQINFLEVNPYHVTSFLNYGAESGDEIAENETFNQVLANHVEGTGFTNKCEEKSQDNKLKKSDSVGERDISKAKKPIDQIQDQERIRKRSKTQVTFELSTLPETKEDNLTEQHTNMGCTDDNEENQYDPEETRNTPRAFTVI